MRKKTSKAVLIAVVGGALVLWRMLKKALVVLLLSGLGAVLLTSISTYVSSTGVPKTVTLREEYDPVIAQAQVQGLPASDVVRKLTGLYFEHYQSQSLPKMEQLQDYKILEIRPISNIPRWIEARVVHPSKGNEGILLYEVAYSVQPRIAVKYCYTWQESGDGGEIAADNWIAHRAFYVQLLQANGHYQLKILSINPSC